MKNRRLFIIGNGFDLEHNLPTKFDPNFRDIATRIETSQFWDLYQSTEDNIWSDFENLLARPDINSLEGIFDGFSVDYLSDRESDRDGIIYQVELNGHLQEALEEFANQAEEALEKVLPLKTFTKMFNNQDLFISFNYTHTLEMIYDIDPEKILYIHGEVDENNLLLGYPEGEFSPTNYVVDPRGRGIGPFVEIEINGYINNLEDYYYRTAYSDLLNKTKSFYKPIKVFEVEKFLRYHGSRIDQIIVYGHSCAIDFSYFAFLNEKYPNAYWEFYVKGSSDGIQRYNVEKLVQTFSIRFYEIIIV